MLLPHAIAQIRDALPALRRGQADVVVTMLQTLLEHLEEVQTELDAERNGRGIDAAELNLLTTIEDVFRRWAGTPVIYHDMFKALDTLRRERRTRTDAAARSGTALRFQDADGMALQITLKPGVPIPERLERYRVELPPEPEGVVHTESGRITLDLPNWTEVPRGRRDIVIPGKNHPVADAP